jgi:mRNA-degrading endonuclease YafQ of YafQ-DinJ toxin-antitoxin module
MDDFNAIRQGAECKAYHTCLVRPDALLVYGMCREADDIGFDCRLV